jgi:hypothetical protein
MARFREEFSTLNNISVVYLEIYDPVSQYALYGEDWDTNDNWTNSLQKRHSYCKIFKNPGYNALNKTNMVEFLMRARSTLDVCTSPLFTDQSDQRFKTYIKEELTKLKNLIYNNRAVLIVAPVTTPPDTKLTGGFRHALDLMNKELEDNAKDVGYIFFDTRKIVNNAEFFIDACCHLSYQGALRLAKELNSLVNDNNDKI